MKPLIFMLSVLSTFASSANNRYWGGTGTGFSNARIQIIFSAPNGQTGRYSNTLGSGYDLNWLQILSSTGLPVHEQRYPGGLASGYAHAYRDNLISPSDNATLQSRYMGAGGSGYITYRILLFSGSQLQENDLQRNQGAAGSGYQSLLFLPQTESTDQEFSARYQGGEGSGFAFLSLQLIPGSTPPLLAMQKERILAYPNPVEANIHFEKLTNRIVSIVNQKGQIVLEAQVKNYRIDVSSLPPGLYFLLAEDQMWKFYKAKVK